MFCIKTLSMLILLFFFIYIYMVHGTVHDESRQNDDEMRSHHGQSAAKTSSAALAPGSGTPVAAMDFARGNWASSGHFAV
jgi:uncharacterized membrane protein